MGTYGYDPSKYIMDYSRYGQDIGNAISSAAKVFPELYDYNRQVHENNNYKQAAFQAVNDYIDQMDFKKTSNILSSMGYSKEVDAGEQVAKDKLKSMIPKYGEKITSQEYDVMLAKNFFVPFMTAAQAQSGGGPLDFGQLFGGLKSGGVQEAMKTTSIGQEITGREQEQKKYELGKNRKVEEEQSQFETTQERGKDSGTIINSAIKESNNDPNTAYDLAIKNGGTENDAKQAFGLVSEKIKLEMEKKRLLSDYAKSKIDANKLDTLDPMDVSTKRAEAARTVGMITDDLQKLEAAQKNSDKKMSNEAFLIQKDALLEQKRTAEDNYKAIQKAQKSGTQSKEQYSKLYTQGLEEAGAERITNSSQLVDAFNTGKYRKIMKSRKEEKENFEKDFHDITGQYPKYDKDGKAIISSIPSKITQLPSNQNNEDIYKKLALAKKAISDPLATPEQKANAQKFIDSNIGK